MHDPSSTHTIATNANSTNLNTGLLKNAGVLDGFTSAMYNAIRPITTYDHGSTLRSLLSICAPWRANDDAADDDEELTEVEAERVRERGDDVDGIVTFGGKSGNTKDSSRRRVPRVSRDFKSPYGLSLSVVVSSLSRNGLRLYASCHRVRTTHVPVVGDGYNRAHRIRFFVCVCVLQHTEACLFVAPTCGVCRHDLRCVRRQRHVWHFYGQVHIAVLTMRQHTLRFAQHASHQSLAQALPAVRGVDRHPFDKVTSCARRQVEHCAQPMQQSYPVVLHQRAEARVRLVVHASDSHRVAPTRVLCGWVQRDREREELLSCTFFGGLVRAMPPAYGTCVVEERSLVRAKDGGGHRQPWFWRCWHFMNVFYAEKTWLCGLHVLDDDFICN